MDSSDAAFRSAGLGQFNAFGHGARTMRMIRLWIGMVVVIVIMAVIVAV